MEHQNRHEAGKEAADDRQHRVTPRSAGRKNTRRETKSIQNIRRNPCGKQEASRAHPGIANCPQMSRAPRHLLAVFALEGILLVNLTIIAEPSGGRGWQELDLVELCKTSLQS